MKKLFYIAMAAFTLTLGGCSPKETADSVMARYVPERRDDFVWENDKICYRAYGPSLESETLSPGFDIWVKKPGALVADKWYAAELEEPGYYHHDHGEGKDCYKVAKSLGGGASSPIVTDPETGEVALVFPDHNYSGYEVEKISPDEINFTLKYSPWQVGPYKVSLRKKIPVTAGSYFCKCEDIYDGDFETLDVFAGIIKHDVKQLEMEGDIIAFWEAASDQSAEPEDGMIGLGLYVPGADRIGEDGPANHAGAVRTVSPGESIEYYFGSCWSKGEITSFEKWLGKMDELYKTVNN